MFMNDVQLSSVKLHVRTIIDDAENIDLRLSSTDISTLAHKMQRLRERITEIEKIIS